MATPAYKRDSGVTSFSSVTSFDVATTPDASGTLLLLITLNASRTVSVSDTGSGTWTRLSTLYSATTAAQTDIWVSYGRANAAITITASWTSTTGGGHTLLEVTEATLSDASSSFDNTTSGTTHYCAAIGEIDTSNDVCVVACGRLGGANTMTAPTGFTRIGSASSAHAFFYRFTATSLTDERAAFSTTGSRTSVAVIASVKAAAAASGAGSIFDGRALGSGRILGGSALC